MSGGVLQRDVYNNGGEWLYAVFPTTDNSEYYKLNDVDEDILEQCLIEQVHS